MTDATDHRAPSPHAIYRIRDMVTGRVYIGSAVNVPNRWSVHLSALRRGKHHSVKLQRAWTERGEGAFALEIVEAVTERTALVGREQYWIDFYDAVECGFNVAPHAASVLGLKHSDESRAKMRDAARGRKNGPMSEAQKELLRAINTGKKMSPESRLKLSESIRGKKRRPHSPATIEKIKLAAKQRGISPAVQEKAWATTRGRPQTSARKAKAGASLRARCEDPSVRLAISEAAKRGWKTRKEKSQCAL